MDSKKKQEEEAQANAAEELNEASSEAAQAAEGDETGQAAGEAAGEDDDVKARLDEALRQIDELKDKYLRLHAEFDNYKKRTVKEKAELIRNGGASTLQTFLPVVDDIERALDAMDKADDIKAVVDGIRLISDKFNQVLTKNGVVPIDTTDAPFDTDYHEAISMVPAETEEQKGKVVACVQTGYKLNDKVLRHAKVVVAQ